MLTSNAESAVADDPAADTLLDKRRLQALGILLPLRLTGISFFSGRHTLGRAGEGMRFLRTRPFESGQDNPRDIDKFSPPGELRINEWEAEAQATIQVFADVSASMQFAPKKSLVNLALLQLTYSLWRAGDRVKTTLVDATSSETIQKRNLKSQLDQLILRLRSDALHPGRDMLDVLTEHQQNVHGSYEDLAFVMSDFCRIRDEPADFDEARWRSLQRKSTCDVVPVVISFALAAGQRGSVRLWDGETNRHKMTLLTPSRIAAINAAEEQRVERLQQRFRGLGMSCVALRRAQDAYPEFAKLAQWRRRHSR
ncbi:MAG: hypothetical protein HKN77_04430 [Woeseiaceae bacterium]|nr:hypothetical protein [Woeseiaceae bacterium]